MATNFYWMMKVKKTSIEGKGRGAVGELNGDEKQLQQIKLFQVNCIDWCIVDVQYCNLSSQNMLSMNICIISCMSLSFFIPAVIPARISFRTVCIKIITITKILSTMARKKEWSQLREVAIPYTRRKNKWWKAGLWLGRFLRLNTEAVMLRLLS